MIMSIQPMRPGAALYLALEPPCGAETIRIIRRWEPLFEGPDDPQAVVVYEGGPRVGAVDWRGLANGVPVYYAAYWWDGAAWHGPSTAEGTPAAEVGGPHPDVLDLVRERLESGLNALVTAGYLRHPRGAFTVLTAPPQLEDVAFPIVAVQLEQDSSDQQFIGGFLGEEAVPGGTMSGTGWLSRVSIQVGAWSLNPDERRLLRRALTETVIRNLDLFGVLGVVQVDYSSGDDEDFQSYAAPLYRVTGRMTCLAPAWIDAVTANLAGINILACDQHLMS